MALYPNRQEGDGLKPFGCQFESDQGHMDTGDLIGILAGESREHSPAPGFLPTGSVSLDIVLGGGWQQGSVSELYGPPDSGTTTVALRSIAAAQRARPGTVAVIYDGSPDRGARLPGRAAQLGADLDRLIIAGRPEALLAVPRETVLTVDRRAQRAPAATAGRPGRYRAGDPA